MSESTAIGTVKIDESCPHLCASCASLHLAAAYWNNAERIVSAEEHDNLRTLRSLQTSSKTCSLCFLILQNVLSAYKYQRSFHNIHWPSLDDMINGDIMMVKNAGKGYILWCQIGHVRIDLCLGPLHGSSVQQPWRDGAVANLHEPLQKIQWVEADPRSNVSLNRIRAWIEQCDHDHPACRVQSSIVDLPDRVLDVGTTSAPQLRLVESKGRRGEYLALSYRWGIENTFVTTNENIEQFKLAIKEHDLHATFRDAVLLTRQLNIRFLWIDGFCIIQKDKVDWDEQSAKMGDIYSNASFTISAASAKSVLDGIFQPRRPPVVQCGTVEIGDQKHGIYACARDVNIREPLVTALVQEPLTNRGWTVQERLLSRRLIHFTSSQLIWQCLEKVESESGEESEATMSTVYQTGLSRWTPRAAPPSKFETWHEIVGRYSQCDLTKVNDRLPAIAGIAQVFATGMHGRYLAGHFEHHLPQTLVWRTMGTKRPHSAAHHPRAPSWSWASVDCAVTIDGTHVDSGQNASLAKMLSAQISLSGTSRYGEVDNGTLNLSAPLMRTRASTKEVLQDLPPGHVFRTCLHNGKPVIDALIAFDGEQLSGEILVLMISSSGNGSRFHTGLALTPTDTTWTRFKRIGAFSEADVVPGFTMSQIEPSMVQII